MSRQAGLFDRIIGEGDLSHDQIACSVRDNLRGNIKGLEEWIRVDAKINQN